MLLAAGRGERMRPLSDHVPKPLLEAGGKALIVWQIERLVRGGFCDIVINYAHLGERIEAALGDGSCLGAHIEYSPEDEALETLGGVAHALPMLGAEPFAVVSADIYTEFDYGRLAAPLRHIATNPEDAVAHFVLTDNPQFHPDGDMGLRAGRITRDGPKLNYGNIAVFHPRLFAGLAPRTRQPLFPTMYEYVERGQVTGEHYRGRWFNIGTPRQLAELNELLREESDV
jgi:MurNAc alpha-1-phosphate uridylyltransferase